MATARRKSISLLHALLGGSVVYSLQHTTAVCCAAVIAASAGCTRSVVTPEHPCGARRSRFASAARTQAPASERPKLESHAGVVCSGAIRAPENLLSRGSTHAWSVTTRQRRLRASVDVRRQRWHQKPPCCFAQPSRPSTAGKRRQEAPEAPRHEAARGVVSGKYDKRTAGRRRGAADSNNTRPRASTSS